MPSLSASKIQPIKIEGEKLLLLDQRKLPEVVEFFNATNLNDLCYAISEMVVRGAPAIGVAAALGLAFEAKRLAEEDLNSCDFWQKFQSAKSTIQATRPTAVNLFWATEAIFNSCQNQPYEKPKTLAKVAMTQALKMIDDDIRTNHSIGEHGATLLAKCSTVLTHCNAGALATCGWGTALGVIRSAIEHGTRLMVYVDETRPRLQGARLTAWELKQDNIDSVLITDSTAGYLMAKGKVDAVIVGADRIAANGDTANKIGTYTLAILADSHGIPFYVAAPLSTIDVQIRKGADIPIEERSPEEVTTYGGTQICTPGVNVFNPAFDVTPAQFISAIITEKGVLTPPFSHSIDKAIAN